MTILSFCSTPSWEETAAQLVRTASDTERLIMAVCYRFETEQLDSSDVSTIVNEYFRRAHWPRPTNLAATANYCASRGWLSEAGQSDGRKLWRLTRTGCEYIKSRTGKRKGNEK